MTKPAKIQIAARTDQLSALHRFFTSEARALHIDAHAGAQVYQAIDEAVTNIIMHGYQGTRGKIGIEISQSGADLVIRITDDAPHFDPTQAPAPDLDLPLEERRIGGLGIHLIRHMVDEVLYRPLPRRGNELVLIKRQVCM